MNTNHYFPHDFNSFNDPKLQALHQKLGYEGIGLFWSVVELMYRENGKLELSRVDEYAYALRTSPDRLHQLIEAIFQHDDIYFWSNGVLQRLKLIKQKKQLARKAANTRWNNASALQPDSGRSPKAVPLKQTKAKESKPTNKGKGSNHQLIPQLEREILWDHLQRIK